MWGPIYQAESIGVEKFQIAISFICWKKTNIRRSNPFEFRFDCANNMERCLLYLQVLMSEKKEREEISRYWRRGVSKRSYVQSFYSDISSYSSMKKYLVCRHKTYIVVYNKSWSLHHFRKKNEIQRYGCFKFQWYFEKIYIRKSNSSRRFELN